MRVTGWGVRAGALEPPRIRIPDNSNWRLGCIPRPLVLTWGLGWPTTRPYCCAPNAQTAPFPFPAPIWPGTVRPPEAGQRTVAPSTKRSTPPPMTARRADDRQRVASPPTPTSDRTPSPHDMRRVDGQHVPGGLCGSGPEAVFTPCAWQRPSAMCYTPKWPPLGGAGMDRGTTPHCPSPPPTHDRAPGWRSTCEMGCAGAARIWHFFVVRIQI